MSRFRSEQQRIFSAFTAREREILRARGRGESYAEIARRLGLTRARAEQIARAAEGRLAIVERAREIARQSNDPFDAPIEILPLSTRSVNALRAHGKRTLRDLSLCTPQEILQMKNLGAESLREIQAVVRRSRRKR